MKPLPLDLGNIRTYPLAGRPSKVDASALGKPLPPGASFAAFLESLPDILAAKDLREVVAACAQARKGGKPLMFGLGSHVIKCGLSPVLVALLKEGVITGLAFNGSGIIHDFELALAGKTSEDVTAQLGSGDFGMAEETGRELNEAIAEGARRGWGLGEAIGRRIEALNPPFRDLSLFWNALQLDLPATVHVALGTDIIHMHPQADGAAIGALSHHDFRLFAAQVRDLDGGGVYINGGSAVILPEVFLKAVSVVRNLGHPLQGLTTVNFDFIRHYRPTVNVVQRPTQDGGKGYSLVGHHEILLPLWAAALREAMAA